MCVKERERERENCDGRLFLPLLQFVGDVRMQFVVHLDQSSDILGIDGEAFLLEVGSSGQGSRDVGLNGLTFKDGEKIGGSKR